jgi:hypothetical protein
MHAVSLSDVLQSFLPQQAQALRCGAIGLMFLLLMKFCESNTPPHAPRLLEQHASSDAVTESRLHAALLFCVSRAYPKASLVCLIIACSSLQELSSCTFFMISAGAAGAACGM